jgi:hypothetical protein
VPSVNVPFSDEEHQVLKANAATWGMYEKDVLKASLNFARLVGARRLLYGVDGEVDIGFGLRVLLDDSPEMRQTMLAIQAFADRLRTLESFVAAAAVMQGDDLRRVRATARKLHTQGPVSADLPGIAPVRSRRRGLGPTLSTFLVTFALVCPLPA